VIVAKEFKEMPTFSARLVAVACVALAFLYLKHEINEISKMLVYIYINKTRL